MSWNTQLYCKYRTKQGLSVSIMVFFVWTHVFIISIYSKDLEGVICSVLLHQTLMNVLMISVQWTHPLSACQSAAIYTEGKEWISKDFQTNFTGFNVLMTLGEIIISWWESQPVQGCFHISGKYTVAMVTVLSRHMLPCARQRTHWQCAQNPGRSLKLASLSHRSTYAQEVY